MDRYTKVVLTIIAGALVYLCVVLTPLPIVHAQTTQRPGEGMGPVQVVVVGWRAAEAVPVAVGQPLEVTGTMQVRGPVVTEPGERASRVLIAGYEMAGTRDRSGEFQPLGPAAGLPTSAR